MKIWQESMAGRTKKSESSSSKQFVCEYCQRGFSKETVLAVHNCETKRRLAQERESGVRLGFHCFNKFFSYLRPADTEKTYREFAESPYYLAFVKFGRYLVEIRAVAPESYCEWLIKNNKKLDHWCRDSYYEEFLLEHIRKEPAGPALERSIQTMNNWAEENQSRFQDYFKYASANRICYDIQAGRISPWSLYCSKTGTAFISQLNEQDLNLIWPWIDSEYWDQNFKKRTYDFEWAKEITAEAGL